MKKILRLKILSCSIILFFSLVVNAQVYHKTKSTPAKRAQLTVGLSSKTKTSATPIPKESSSVPKKVTLLLICNMDCYISVDGKVLGKLNENEPLKTTVANTTHIVICKSLDGKDIMQQKIEADSTEQQIINLDLLSLKKMRTLSSTRNLIAEMSKGLTEAKIDKLIEFINAGADPLATTPCGNNSECSLTTLHFAACKNSIDLFNALVNTGADIDAKTSSGRTPIRVAIHFNAVEVAKALIEKGANINITNGVCLLNDAVIQQNETMVLLIIENGANVNGTCEQAGNHWWSPLHIASKLGNVSMAKLLISKGANKNAQNPRGESPMYIAANAGKIEMIRFLISAGANVNLADKGNRTPLIAAISGTNCANCEYPIEAQVRLLIDNGANVNKEDDNGDTPLSMAVKLMESSWLVHPEMGKRIAKILIENGADLYAKNKKGEAPFSLASRKNKKILTSFRRK